MARITKFVVYVDKAVMDDPSALYDAVFKHLVKKEVDFPIRKKFTAGFMKAHETNQVAYIDTWVLIRDAKTFPLRYNKKVEAPGVIGAKAGAALRKQMLKEKADG